MIPFSGGQKKLTIFNAHVHVHDIVSSRNSQRRFYSPLTEDQNSFEMYVVITEKHPVFLEKDPGVCCLCKTVVDLIGTINLPFKGREVWIEFTLDGAEMRCHVLDKEKKRELKSFKLDVQFHQMSSFAMHSKDKRLKQKQEQTLLTSCTADQDLNVRGTSTTGKGGPSTKVMFAGGAINCFKPRP